MNRHSRNCHAVACKSIVGRRREKTTEFFERLEPRQLFSTYTVNSLSDAAAVSPGVLTLRQAIAAANAHPGADTIAFANSLFGGGAKTITLNGQELTFTDTTAQTVIDGPGESLLTVSGDNASRVFHVDAGANVEILGLNVTGGAAPVGADGNSEGGGIYNAGTLDLTAIDVSGNKAVGVMPVGPQQGAEGLGGGIYSTGTLVIQDSTITSNSANGGALKNSRYVDGSPTASYDGQAGEGGGIYSAGPLTISRSTISLNSASGGVGGQGDGIRGEGDGGLGVGGGINALGSLSVSDSTLSGNFATGGSAAGASSPSAPSYAGSAIGGARSSARPLN